MSYSKLFQSICLSINEYNFDDEIFSSKSPIIIAFWADWCGSCHIIAPAIEELACEFEGRVKMGILDIDDNMELADKFGINVLPTFLFFKKENLLDRVTGVISRKELKNRVLSLL